jgi:phage terminase small subunit
VSRAERAPDARALRPQLAAFVLEYLKDFNGVRAYLASHPACSSRVAAATGAYRTLRNAQVAQAVEAGRREAEIRLRMETDEALRLISLDARADISELFDDQNNLLPVSQWPESTRRSVRHVKHGPNGVEVRLNDSLKARELMAIAGGALRAGAGSDHQFDHLSWLQGIDDPKGVRPLNPGEVLPAVKSAGATIDTRPRGDTPKLTTRPAARHRHRSRC